MSTIFEFPKREAKYNTACPLTSFVFMSNGTSNSQLSFLRSKCFKELLTSFKSN